MYNFMICFYLKIFIYVYDIKLNYMERKESWEKEKIKCKL